MTQRWPFATKRAHRKRYRAHFTLEVFEGAFDIARGGRYGDKDHPQSKEQAGYNLKYLVAVVLLDGQAARSSWNRTRPSR